MGKSRSSGPRTCRRSGLTTKASRRISHKIRQAGNDRGRFLRMGALSRSTNHDLIDRLKSSPRRMKMGDETKPALQWPGVLFAYEYVQPSYEYVAHRMETIENRIRALLTIGA